VWGCGGNQTEPSTRELQRERTTCCRPYQREEGELIASTGLIGNMTCEHEVKNIGSKIDASRSTTTLSPEQLGSPIPCVGFTDAQYYGIVNDANQRQIGKRLNDIMHPRQYDSAKHIKIYEDEWEIGCSPSQRAGQLAPAGHVMDAISTRSNCTCSCFTPIASR